MLPRAPKISHGSFGTLISWYKTRLKLEFVDFLNFYRQKAIRPASRPLILAIGLTLTLGSCSLTPNDTSVTFSLPPPVGQSGESIWQQTEKTENYSTFIGKSEEGSKAVHATGIRKCKQSRKTPIPTTTRELLVGFTKVRFLERTKVNLANYELDRSILTANLDNQTLKLAIYSLWQSDCLYDFALWQAQTNPPSDITASLQQFDGYLKANLPKLVR